MLREWRGGGHMCNCRSFVSRVLLFLCLANMQPTLTALSMNSFARVYRGELSQREEGQGAWREKSTGTHPQHALHIGVQRVRGIGIGCCEAVSHAAAQNTAGREFV